MNMINEINPFHTSFQEATRTFSTLSTTQKTVTIAVSIIAGIFTPFILFTGSFYAFTKSVQHFKDINEKTDSPVTRVTQAAQPILGHRRRDTTQAVERVSEPLRKLNQIETEDVNPHLAITREVKSVTIPTLDRYGFSVEEYLNICLWYEFNKEDLESDNFSRHLKPKDTGLSKTVIYISEGPQKGLHVRSKITVGIGAFNKTTRALHLDTGESKVARSGRKSDVSSNEIASNARFSKIDPDGEYFATGAFVEHRGSWKDRLAIKDQCGDDVLPDMISELTQTVPKQANVKKITLIMDEIPDQELSKDLYKQIALRKLSRVDYMKILIHLNKGLILAHSEGIVDLDYKPENILMDGLTPKMMDFGLAYSSGSYVSGGKGTRGYRSPEMLKRTLFLLSVQPANQMWIQGCIMAHMFKGRDFEDWTEQLSGKPFKIVMTHGFEEAINRYFPENKVEGTIDWCIAQCLQYDAADRISAEELQPHLEKLLREMR